MSTRLLLKLAGPVPSWKKCAAPVRKLLNEYCQVSVKDTRRHIILSRIHRPSKILQATQTQKPCYSTMQCIRAAFANIFVTNISAPPLAAIREIFGCENFATYSIWQYCSKRLWVFAVGVGVGVWVWVGVVSVCVYTVGGIHMSHKYIA